ncbi:FKBP-type peptidyl-prolyl cis-trans isomerase [Escherichia coli]|nr:FKBP-type peptidyl-prolyl cis-trans isomerase [Escherichia coli]ELO3196608.1 FKBP-type peptidyl-prolyl cis-trans isomerase [Escherichia coli]EMD3343491.1 FKBP-type peptidyl-prolyl cis-trans isomerase [Escherichia coli]
MRLRKNILFLTGICYLFFYFCGYAEAAEDDGVPGILRYARTLDKPEAKEGSKKNRGDGITEPGRESVNGADLKKRLARSEEDIRQLRRENRHLREKMAASERKGDKPDGEMSPGQQRQSLQKMHEQCAEETTRLKQQLSEKEGLLATSDGKKLAEMQSRMIVVEKDNQRLKSSLDDITRQMKLMPVVVPEQLNTPQNQQTYAAGVMMGRDILSLQAVNAFSGQKTDNRILLAGVRDALNHKELLNEMVLQKALRQAEEDIRRARLDTARKWKKDGERWLADFRKQKGVQKDKSGFWYRIDYAGDGELINGDDTVVDIVVVEKLTNGTVVEDMDARGAVISQPLNEYPPLFRAALRLLRNHGTVTVVAPSELAYGDEGYPSGIPPGATMIYTIRVESVKDMHVGDSGAVRAISSEKTKGTLK